MGSANVKGTTAHGDDVVNNLSARGPTRGKFATSSGVQDRAGVPGSGARSVTGSVQGPDELLMVLSGTSISAPVVAGTAALMLEVNAGLTPPLVEAIPR